MASVVGLFNRLEKYKMALIDIARRKEARDHIPKRKNARISKPQLAEIKQIWGGTHGNKMFWEFYTTATGIFDARYVPDDLYYTDIDACYNDRKGYAYLDHKCYYETYFPDVLQPKTIAKRINGYWIIKDNIVSQKEVIDYCRQYHAVFIKQADYSCGGHGVFKMDMTTTNSDSFDSVVKKIRTDIIIQEPIIQHESLSRINPNAVNTIRIVTWLDQKGDIAVLSKVLRVGIGDAYVDNASSGGIVVGIDDNNCLKEYAYAVSGERFSVHPTTEVVFKGIALPSLDKAVGMVEKLQMKFPHYRLTSWDISIDEKERPVLIEFNIHHGQLDFHQFCNGPLFGDRTQEMIEEVYGRVQQK